MIPSSGVTLYGRLPLYQSEYRVFSSGPMTATFFVAAGFSGRAAWSFLSRTIASSAALRDSAWWAASSMTAGVILA